MNLLAHLHLADPDAGLMLGGVVADFARNAEVDALPESVQAGVRLHRAIDGFTDRHPVVQRSIGRVSARLGWFSGIVIDIYYDYLLTRTWSRYAAEPLSSFTRRAYRTLDGLSAVTPPGAGVFLQRFIGQDYIHEYSTLEGITRTLARVSRRIADRLPKRALWLPDSVPDLVAADADLLTDFGSFYPELITFAGKFRDSGSAGPRGPDRPVQPG